MTNGSIDIPAAGSGSAGVKPSVDECISEGQFQMIYFPNCKSEEEYIAFIQGRIDSAEVDVRKQIGAANYATTDPDNVRQIHDCIMYLALSKLWQAVVNVMVAYSAEALPPEWVNVEAAIAIRDFYTGEATRLSQGYDTSPGPTGYVGMFTSS